MIPGIVAQAATGESNDGSFEGNVELLLGFNAANGSTVFSDEGRRRRPISFVGNVSHSNAQSKFGGTSGVFDGANDGLLIPPGPGLQFGTAPFTVECWVRFASLNPTIQFIAAHRFGDAAENMAWSLAKNAANKIELFVSADARPAVVTLLSTNAVVTNTWYHIAFDRDEEGVLRLYVNGVMQGKAIDIISMTDCRKAVTIGASGFLNSFGIAESVSLNGHLDEVRIVKGGAVYASDAGFIPPLSAHPRPTAETTPPADPYYNNVIALFGFDGAEGSYTVRDDSPVQRKQKLKTGDLSNTKAQGAFGGNRRAAAVIPVAPGVLYFDDAADLVLGVQPFTVEVWLRQSAWGANAVVIGQRVNGNTQTGQAWNLTALDNGRIEWQMIDVNATVFSVATPVPTNSIGRQRNVFVHCAVTRDNAGTVRLYVNGVLELQQAPASLPFNVRDVATDLSVFGSFDVNGLTYVGSADELRVTKGVARYVDPKFDIPETAFSRGEGGPPAFSVVPAITSISGFFAVGDALRVSYGTHNGYDPAVQWRRDGVAIPGAIGRGYTLAADDAGASIDAGVNVWNYSGEATAYAAPVGPVAAAPAFETGGLTPAGDMQDGGDRLIPEGDMQSGGDVLLWTERSA